MSNPRASFVQFYMDEIHLPIESKAAGRPVYKSVPFIRKMTPGDASNIVERVAKEWDKEQHPQEWRIFEQKEKNEIQGTPLSHWPQINKAQIKEAEYFNVYTVEQLSQMSDMNCQKLGMGWRELRDKAIKWLNAATAGAQAEENDALKKRLAEVEAQLAEIAEVKRGRPKKETAEV